jgi:glycerate-2-kinase
VSPALVDLGDAVVTGATGTNVNDLLLVLVAPS